MKERLQMVDLGTAAAKQLIATILKEIATQASSAIKTKITQYKQEKNIDEIHKRIRRVRFVKTIWQFEKEVDLMDFFQPAKAITDSGRKKEIKWIDDFGYTGNIVITGIVGQGKSILFRYLVWESESVRDFV